MPPPPVPPYDGAERHSIDLTRADAERRLAEVFAGADAVVDLAWAIQPVRDEASMRRTNVDGTAALLRAVRRSGVGHLVFASSLGAYASAPRDAARPVDESWPVTGQPRSAYSRDKLIAERMLDAFERDDPGVAVARVRPTLVVQREAAREMARLFLGPAVPRALLALLRDGRIPLFPVPTGTVLQFVHADDLGRAFAAILERRSRGAFNIAADALDARALTALIGARPVPVPHDLARAVVELLFRLHALAMSAGWFDVAVRTPVMDTGRARLELGWAPKTGTAEAVRVLLEGVVDDATLPSPALAVG
ncbi:NAD-dependent epimerase/dehydratase family protein [Pseudonocardia kujensis]|uniref:NAD-dependent epimerase/dehydratase family protein n=1 Tax=Pseudonocardia kujensis TaxID=1128675 RepID=UPI001E57096B|nr:NAD-dependent epimerase/dehydratase family protein [Pseudonocardia kujensis]MCE0761508.1 NAD-dependent epimerase/dehydratase family protein [Pseudonocardia kujensis]